MVTAMTMRDELAARLTAAEKTLDGTWSRNRGPAGKEVAELRDAVAAQDAAPSR
jgi:hypothetical protein